MTTLDMKLRSKDLFDSLGQEQEEQDREVELQESLGLKRLIEGHISYMTYLVEVSAREGLVPKIRRNSPDDFIPKDYSAADLTALSLKLPRLAKLGHQDTASYLNRAINLCPENEITIITNGWEQVDCYIGSELQNKSVSVVGDVYGIGDGMKSGTLHVRGNVPVSMGEVNSGIGWGMKGGEIYIEGDVMTFRVGESMRGGSIHIMGDAPNSDFMGENMVRGRIYHRGKLIKINGRDARWYDRLLHMEKVK